MILFCRVSAAEPPSTEKASDSFNLAWSAFESACRNGDAAALTKYCAPRIVAWLEGKSLGEFLGAGWKAESVTIKRRVILVPHEKYPAAAFVVVEIAEAGRSKLQAMWWVFSDSKWVFLNLPFEGTLLPSMITFPPLVKKGPNQALEPTTLLVTIRAAARLAPSRVVAHR